MKEISQLGDKGKKKLDSPVPDKKDVLRSGDDFIARRFGESSSMKPKDLYTEILGGDYERRAKKQERLQELDERFQGAQGRIERITELMQGHDSVDRSGLQNFKRQQSDIARSAEANKKKLQRTFGFSMGSSKKEKYEAERDYRDAIGQLEGKVEELREYLKACPVDIQVKGLIESIRPLSSSERETMAERFGQRYRSVVDRSDSFVDIETRVQGTTDIAHYRNMINPINGIITNFANDRDRDRLVSRPGQEAMQLSDVMGQQCREASDAKGRDIKDFVPTQIDGQAISHKQTVEDLKPYVRKGEAKRFDKGSEGYYAVLATTLGKNKLFFLGNYFPNREITHIIVTKGKNDSKIERISYYLGEKGSNTATASDRVQEKMPDRASSSQRLVIE
jgi:hypothetical protein